MSNNELHASGETIYDDPSPARDGGASHAPERWMAPYAYSRVLSNSVKKMMGTRPRIAAVKSTLLGSSSEDLRESASASQIREHELVLFAEFAKSVDRKDKEAMLSLIIQHPHLMRIRDQEDRLALHLVCSLEPVYFYADVMDILVQANEESPASMDKNGLTPLHILCKNKSVTSQVLSTLLMAMPASAVMCDKRSFLAIHYLCCNLKCTVDMLWSLGHPDTYALKNDELRMPIHCVASTLQASKIEVFLHLLHSYPNAAASIDSDGRSALHWICESELVNGLLLDELLPLSGNAPCKQDQYLDLPLHILCRNSSISIEILKRLLQANPEAVFVQSEIGLSPLHILCANDALSTDLLASLLSSDKDNRTASTTDSYGATPLHHLCMNESISAGTLRALLRVSTDSAFGQDVHGRSPMHYLCMNGSISSELVWLFLERAQDIVRDIDLDGKTPLHHLCANKSVMAVTLEILYDACPGATVVADMELRLPIQYLVDNPLSPAETTALLVSGPASYRLRYDFLTVVGGTSAVSFLRNNELIHTQTNLAIDSTASNAKVWIKFLSSDVALNHEHSVFARLNSISQRMLAQETSRNFSIRVIDDFDDAKRRVNIRQIRADGAVAPEDHIASDTSITLDYGLVIEAPTYTLEGLYVEPLTDMGSIRAIIQEIGDCLFFWHREMLMVHGNVTLESIGYFADRGLSLLHFHTSRQFHERVTLSAQSMKVTSVPPEAARSFLTTESFEPTTFSDMWQFGCLVFQLVTGKSLLAAAVPWSAKLGYNQLLHFICALSDEVIHEVIAEVDGSLRGILEATLVINPTRRWGIDRLMQMNAFKTHADSNLGSVAVAEKVHSHLQRNANTELLATEYQRNIKHTQEQLDFMKSEQRLLREQYLVAKRLLHESEETTVKLKGEVDALTIQLGKLKQQKQEIQQESRALTRNYQSMTQQLHTTMQMLLNLVPLASKVYGAHADAYLSTILAHSTGAGTTTLGGIDIEGVNASLPLNRQSRRRSAVEKVKAQLQDSLLAHGCLSTWARSTPPSTLEPPYFNDFNCYSRSDLDDEVTRGYYDEGTNQENESGRLNVPGMWEIPLDNEPQAGCFLVEAEDAEEIC